MQLDGITDRIVRVTPQSTYLSDAILTNDGETLFYTSESPEGGVQMWKFVPREDEHSLVTKIAGAPGFEATPDGKTSSCWAAHQ